MDMIKINEIAKECNIKNSNFLIFRDHARKIKEKITQEFPLRNNFIILDFDKIEAITGSVIDEIVMTEYERHPQKKSKDFLGAFGVTNLGEEVLYSVESELLARMKRKEKSNEFMLYIPNQQELWKILPEGLEPKLVETLTWVMEKKELSSTDLASLNKEEDISTKNARIRLEKLFNLRLVKKKKGEGKEYIYQALF